MHISRYRCRSASLPLHPQPNRYCLPSRLAPSQVADCCGPPTDPVLPDHGPTRCLPNYELATDIQACQSLRLDHALRSRSRALACSDLQPTLALLHEQRLGLDPALACCRLPAWR